MIKETKALPKVNDFLTAVENNSAASANLYLISLSYCSTFLASRNKGETLENILEPLKSNKMDRYEFMQQFINYLIGNNSKKLSAKSIKSYIRGVKSYLANNKIFFIPQEYKQCVREPKIFREDMEPLDSSDIRKILLQCTDKRLKAFLFVLGTGGPRVHETISVRLKDIDFTSSPTKISLRAEHTKTRKARYFFITDEATRHLKDWIDYKYRRRDREKYNIARKDTDYVFAVYDVRNPKLRGIYQSLMMEFNSILDNLKMDERKDGMLRRKITMHGLRAFVYSTLSDVDPQFAEWMLGHDRSTYWRKKPEVMRQKYLDCMKYFRFLDYEEIKLENKTIDAKLEQKDKQIELLKKQMEELRKGTAEHMTVAELNQSLMEKQIRQLSDYMVKDKEDRKRTGEDKKNYVYEASLGPEIQLHGFKSQRGYEASLTGPVGGIIRKYEKKPSEEDEE